MKHIERLLVHWSWRSLPSDSQGPIQVPKLIDPHGSTPQMNFTSLLDPLFSLILLQLESRVRSGG